MLQALDIRNFALIEKISIEWVDGLNVLTGETGAGKSIVIDALNIVLGGKAVPNNVRAGAERATIEAVFRPTEEIAAWLKLQELQSDADTDELSISREISKTGSRARINGSLVNLNLLQELGQKLLTIHTQHEARSLLAPATQLELIDGLGGDENRSSKNQVQVLYSKYREIKGQIKELESSEEERVRKLDYARFQFEELQQAALVDANEFETVHALQKRLSNVAQLEASTLAAGDLLTGSDSLEARSAMDLLTEALQQIDRVSDCDQQLAQVNESLRYSIENLEEIARGLRRYRESLETDPQELSQLELRLNQLAGIRRKYGPSLTDAIERRESLAEEIQRLENSEAAFEKLEKELQLLNSQLKLQAESLSQQRKKIATQLAKAVKKELSDLGMEACRFEIAFEETEPGADGIDKVEMLIAPNPGHPLLPVSKIASGGELSRVMLAIKSIFARADKVDTVVFDEIDTGLSGKVLQAVRDKLSRLSKSHQILCITHQPMIASIADNHMLINKTHTVDSTAITIAILEKPDRIKSVASMASGYDNQKEALNFAESLFNEANALRSSADL